MNRREGGKGGLGKKGSNYCQGREFGPAFARSAISIHQTQLMPVVWTPFCLSKQNLKDC